MEAMGGNYLKQTVNNAKINFHSQKPFSKCYHKCHLFTGKTEEASGKQFDNCGCFHEQSVIVTVVAFPVPPAAEHIPPPSGSSGKSSVVGHFYW
jgi:hypothetical protein